MATVVWLKEAALDVARLRLFLAPKNPDAAKRAAATIGQAAQQLIEHPKSGSPMDDGTGRHKLFAPFSNGGNVLRYKVNGNIVVIIRVWHSREDR